MARGVAGRLMQADESNLTLEEAAFTVTGTERQIIRAEFARGAAESASCYHLRQTWESHLGNSGLARSLVAHILGRGQHDTGE